MQQCDPGHFCLNGLRGKCPFGYICPTGALSRPYLCTEEPNGLTTCFEEQLANPIPCPEGTLCDTNFLPPIPASPGYYVTDQKTLKKCLPGDWCSLGRFSSNGSGLLCPQNTFCRVPEILQPSICVSNVTHFRYCPAGSVRDGYCPSGYFCKDQLTKDNCSIGEYCPEGTFVPKPCEKGYYCPDPAMRYVCPSGSFCKTGSSEPTPCLAISYCPQGTYDEGNFFILPLTLAILVASLVIYKIWDMCLNYTNEKWNQLVYVRSKHSSRNPKDRNRFIIDIGFENLSVKLASGKVILDNVSGGLKHGRLTAIMGLSGSGKTTLLTTLSGRQWVGKIRGNITFNGQVMQLSNYYKLVGFVPQEDIMLRVMTVYETLYFAARTKLSWRKSNYEIDQIVNNAIMELGLEDIRDSVIGDEERRGISGGQRKRVNIGIEMVSDPSVLFLGLFDFII